MADEINISYGGAIAVRTEELRALLPRLHGATQMLHSASAHLSHARYECAGIASEWGRAAHYGALAQAAAVRADDLAHTAGNVRLMIEAYELVEQRVRAEQLAATDPARAAQLRAALDAAAGTPADQLADTLLRDRETDRFRGFAEQALAAVPFAAWFTPTGASALSLWLLLRGLQSLVAQWGHGLIPPGARLGGAAPPVRVRPTERSASRAPGGIRDALDRIPDSEAQLRVETYELADGTREYAVYVAGTRALGDGDVLNMASNLSLYFGETAASFEAVRQALADAGVPPGATIHAVGHSQGGMIVSRLASEGEYDVRTLVTAGSPVEAAVPETTLSVQLRHTDDAVSMLAGGGSAAGTGAPGSLVVERVGDPAGGIHDLALATHHLPRYLETAAMVDASADVRVESVRQTWAHLGTAVAVTAVEYRATPAPPQNRSSSGGR